MDLIIANRALSILYTFLKFYKNQNRYTLLVPSNICHDVFFLILHLEIPYVFLDIEADSLSINKECVRRVLKDKRQAILLYNHTYGDQHIPYEFFREIKCISNEALIVDDRCLCLPSMELSPSDYIIDLILYSTGRSKQVDLAKNGFGFIKESINVQSKQIEFNEESYETLRHLFNVDIKQLIDSKLLLSTCIRFTQNQSIAISEYIGMIEAEMNEWNDHKERTRHLYEANFPSNVQLPSCFNDWRFNILVKKKNLILNDIFKNRLFASSHYPSIGTRISGNQCGTADQLHKSVLNLFIDKNYTEEMALQTIRIINQHLAI